MAEKNYEYTEIRNERDDVDERNHDLQDEREEKDKNKDFEDGIVYKGDTDVEFLKKMKKKKKGL